MRLSLFAASVLATALFLASPASAQKGVEGLNGLFRNDFSAVIQQTSTTPVSAQHGADFVTLDANRPAAPNTFITIFGPVSPDSPAQATGGSGAIVNETTDWGQFFVDGQAPTTLGGVQVMVNGVPAPIAFTGLADDFNATADQINLVVPAATSEDGMLLIDVIKDGTSVGSTMVPLGTLSPALFAASAFQRDGNTFLAATSAGFQILLPPELLQPGSGVRAARSGETIILFGTGFGGTTPDVPIGQIVTVLSQLNEPPTVTIGGMSAAIVFAGLAPNLADVYQFNVEVPQLADGDHEVVIELGGVSTPSNFVIPVDNSTAAVDVP